MKTLKRIANKLKENKEVKGVYLFGSFARGDYLPSSDIDVLLLVEKSERRFLERAEEFLKFFEGLPFDVNLLVYTQEEFEKHKGTPFMRGVLKEATEL